MCRGFMSSHTEPDTLALMEKTRSYGYILKGSPDQVITSSIRQAFNLFRDRMKDLSLKENLAMEKQRQASIIEGTNTGTWEWNIVTGEVLFNEHWAGMLGYTLDELSPLSIDTWIRLTHPDDFKSSAELLERHFSGETDYYEMELRMRHSEGHWVWILDRGRVSSWSGDREPLIMRGTHHDITIRKRMEEMLIRQLQEKELLLRETHHRIKNNISSIMNFLSLQADNSSSEEANIALRGAVSRINSMSGLYDRMLLSGEYAEVPVASYINDITDSVISLFACSARISVEKKLDDFRFSSRQMLNLGLIVNELLTNSMKYAFTGRESGNVLISVARRGDLVRLDIQDDGNGLPDGFSMASSMGFGLTLVNMLSRQLGGNFRIENNSGTLCSLEFSAVL